MQTPDPNSTVSVHDALVRASDVTRQPRLEPYSVKVNPRHLEAGDLICKRHGTNVAEFMRQCLAGLVHDYGGDVEAMEQEQPALPARAITSDPA